MMCGSFPLNIGHCLPLLFAAMITFTAFLLYCITHLSVVIELLLCLLQLYLLMFMFDVLSTDSKLEFSDLSLSSPRLEHNVRSNFTHGQGLLRKDDHFFTQAQTLFLEDLKIETSRSYIVSLYPKKPFPDAVIFSQAFSRRLISGIPYPYY